MMRAELTLSRLPVGSSASRMEGSLARARAMATRWRSPAESSLGYWWRRCFKAHLAQQSFGTLGAVVRVLANGQHRHLHVFNGAQRGQQIKGLKDESHLVSAVVVEIDGGAERLRSERGPRRWWEYRVRPAVAARWICRCRWAR